MYDDDDDDDCFNLSVIGTNKRDDRGLNAFLLGTLSLSISILPYYLAWGFA